MNSYAYVKNDPINWTDSTGKYGCGRSLSDEDCREFLAAQEATKARLSEQLSIIKGMQDKLAGNGEFSASETRVADRISKMLGAGAGRDSSILGRLISTGNKMLGVLNGNMPAERGSGSSDYAHADPGQLTLFAAHFSSSSKQQIQTIAHEASHHGANTIDLSLGQGRGKPILRIYGAENSSRYAAYKQNPGYMLGIADPVTLALGLSRDDGWK